LLAVIWNDITMHGHRNIKIASYASPPAIAAVTCIRVYLYMEIRIFSLFAI